MDLALDLYLRIVDLDLHLDLAVAGLVTSLVAGVCRTLNLLWLPECMSKCHSEFKDAFEMTEAEKLLIFGRCLY